jgi:hypothetical protein
MSKLAESDTKVMTEMKRPTWRMYSYVLYWLLVGVQFNCWSNSGCYC